MKKITKESLKKELEDLLNDDQVEKLIKKFDFDIVADSRSKPNVEHGLSLKGDENKFDNAKLKENQAKLTKDSKLEVHQGITVDGKGNTGVGIEISGNLVDEQEREIKNYAVVVVKEDEKRYFNLLVGYKVDDDDGKTKIEWISRYPDNNLKNPRFFPDEQRARNSKEKAKQSILKKKDYHIDDDSYLGKDQKEGIKFDIEEGLGIGEGLIVSIDFFSNKVQEQKAVQEIPTS